MPKEVFYDEDYSDRDLLGVRWGEDERTGVAVYTTHISNGLINLTEKDLDRLITTLTRIRRGLTEVVPGDIVTAPSRKTAGLEVGSELLSIDGDYKGYIFNYVNEGNWQSIYPGGDKLGLTFDDLAPGKYVVSYVGKTIGILDASKPFDNSKSK